MEMNLAVAQVPKTALVTQFHALQLYPDRVKAVCVLNEQVTSDILSISVSRLSSMIPTTERTAPWWVSAMIRSRQGLG